MSDLTRDELTHLLDYARLFQNQAFPQRLKGKIIGSCFFEPSTRTRLSFESAALRLGGNVLGFSSAEGLSIKKGETLQDTMRMMSNYADLLVIRHPHEGAAALAAQAADCPVINAGDGANQHPTQALTDFFTIQSCQSKLDGLSIALVGDLKYGRTVHSFIDCCSLFDIRLYLVAPDILNLPDSMTDKIKKRGVQFSFHQTIEEVLPAVDIVYLTRIQQERFGKADYQLIQQEFTLDVHHLHRARPNMKILHPLPRNNELCKAIDQTPFAYYFEQAKNAVPVRQALLDLILNEHSL